MFRIRAVEAPADEKGLRKVWHRGARNAELVSELDVDGHVVRQEFTLFEDVVIWRRGQGLSTAGASDVSRQGERIEPDLFADPTRLERVASALRPYQGDDRIIAHLRMLLNEAGPNPVEGRGRVTTNPSLLVAPASAVAPPRARQQRWALWGAAALVAAATIWLLVK